MLKKPLPIGSIALFGFWFQQALANNLIPCADGTLADPSLGCALAPGHVVSPTSLLIPLLLKGVSKLSLAIVFLTTLGIILSGIRYATALGDEEKVEQAKRNLFWTGFGFLVSGLAYGIVGGILRLFIV